MWPYYLAGAAGLLIIAGFGLLTISLLRMNKPPYSWKEDNHGQEKEEPGTVTVSPGQESAAP
jgi:hypothetical protein